MKVLRALVEAVEREEACALATVVATEGSSPASSAMRMLVGTAGRLAGSVGGGRVEAEVEAAAQAVLGSGVADVRTFTLTDELADEGGLICGGTVRILVERVEPPASWAAHALALMERGRRGVHLARFGDTVEHRVVEGDEAEAHLTDEAPRLEDGTLFVEPLVSPRCIIVGAGHVGRATARVAAVAGFRIAIVEDRPDQAERARPLADRVECAPLEEGFSKLETGPDDFVLVMTRAHGLDRRCVAAALRSPARYVGMLASRRKTAAIREALAAEGVEARRLHAPVGLDLGAVSAGEIAVAVVAQLVKVRRMGRGDR